MKLSREVTISGSAWLVTLAAGIFFPPVFFVLFCGIGFAVSAILILRQQSARVAGTPSDNEDGSSAAEVEGPLAETDAETDAEPSTLEEVEHVLDPVEIISEEMLDLLSQLEAEIASTRRSGPPPQLARVLHITEDELRPRLGSLKQDTQQILQNVNRSYDISDNLSKTASNAFSLAAKVQKGIENINQSLQQSLQNTAFLEEQSKKISRILDLMSDISSQIQVLSMNASIVSARAGIHGKGFEVVAKEIRNLSHETENSLQEISSSIKEIQGTISTVSLDTQQADQAAAEETKSLMSVAGALQGVQLAVEVVHTVSTQSKEKIQQQADVLQQIEDMYNRLDEELRDLESDSSETDSAGDLVSRLKELLGGHMSQREM